MSKLMMQLAKNIKLIDPKYSNHKNYKNLFYKVSDAILLIIKEAVKLRDR